MSLIHRTPVIVCLLLVAAFLFPAARVTTAQVPGPSLAVASMATSPLGTVVVTGSGFTPGGLVRIVIHDLWGLGPTVDFWVIAPAGAISEQLPYLAAATYGPHGSQDPALGYAAGTSRTLLMETPVFGTNGSQDPALGYVGSELAWPDGCPDLEVRGWDARSDTWSNPLDVKLAGC